GSPPDQIVSPLDAPASSTCPRPPPPTPRPARFPLPPHLREALQPLRYKRHRRLGASAPPRVASLPGRSPPARLDSRRHALLFLSPARCPVPWLLAASRTLACPELLGPVRALRG
ncbi:hypothetical protein BS78_10G140100, partial [Paspalum vaginatum]